MTSVWGEGRTIRVVGRQGGGRSVDVVLRLLVATLLVLATSLVAPSTGMAATLRLGELPPQKLNSKVNLGDYRGKIVIISFWASWCPPCRKELPILAAIQKQATRDKLVVFAVDWREDVDMFFQIQRAFKNVDLTLLSDSSGYIGRQYDVSTIPHMIVIGRDGRIAAIHIGYSEAEIPIVANEINSLWNHPQAVPEPHPPG